MAELDFAFLCDFARVEPNGTLTALNASWTHIGVRDLPLPYRMAVAGRVRATVDEALIPIRLEISGPGETPSISVGFELIRGAQQSPYDGVHIGHVFALELPIILDAEGLYEVRLYLHDAIARRLAFEVRRPEV